MPQISCMQNHCKHKKKIARPKKGAFLSLLSGVLIAIIPKCPLCIFAYSSAITMCSGAKLQEESFLNVDWFYINLFLSIVTLSLILFNYKGKKTWIAATLAIAACSMLLLLDLASSPVLYYLSCALLFIAVWMNGSFTWFIRKWMSTFSPSLKSSNS